MSDFFEPDEPVEDVKAAFDAGEKRSTERPADARLVAVPGHEIVGLPPGTTVQVGWPS